MKGEQEKLWTRLCREAATEDDPARMPQIIDHINRMLYEKELRLKQQSAKSQRAQK